MIDFDKIVDIANENFIQSMVRDNKEDHSNDEISKEEFEKLVEDMKFLVRYSKTLVKYSLEAYHCELMNYFASNSNKQ